MAKFQKQKDILRSLHAQIEKQAAAQENLSGVPLEDTKAESVGDETETVDQNAIGADKVQQTYEQHTNPDPDAPAKTASALEDLANSIVEEIDLAKEAACELDKDMLAETDAKSVPDKTETVEQNAVGADKCNKEQGVKQKKAPEEVINKTASYNLGVQFCEAILNNASAALEKQAAAAHERRELIKEAGRRDFDYIIAKTAAALEREKEIEERTKVAEEERGAADFEEQQKLAFYRGLYEENQALHEKLAEYEAYTAQLEQAEQIKVAQETYQRDLVNSVAPAIASYVMEQLKNTSAGA